MGVLFCGVHISSLSLSTNHVSLFLSLSSFCCMTCASSRDYTLLVSLTDCPHLAWDFSPEPPAGQTPGAEPKAMPSQPWPAPAPRAHPPRPLRV